jgi:Mrp family chromosome partitioning ATPase
MPTSAGRNCTSIFDVANEQGFGNVFTSAENSSVEAVQSDQAVPNLDLLTAGAKPANATELLESAALIDFIERALEEYDHVVFDSGPMLFVSETVALAPRVDGVVTVVRARTNSRGLLQRMRDALRQLKAEHLGVVLNAVRTRPAGTTTATSRPTTRTRTVSTDLDRVATATLERRPDALRPAFFVCWSDIASNHPTPLPTRLRCHPTGFAPTPSHSLAILRLA